MSRYLGDGGGGSSVGLTVRSPTPTLNDAVALHV